MQHDIDTLCINTIRTLSMDAVQRANSGHPGTPMALAPLAHVLWSRVLRYNPKNPAWFNRDRFVLSAGHASILQYALLHLTGYDLSLDELKDFRQWGSRTPGHPEYHHTPGIETTTGPLGQGIMNGVGMAMAEAHLAAVFNRPGHDIIDHHTYVFCGDGDLMEGPSHEAASLAGHLGLGKLICVFDDNRITIEGSTDLACSDSVRLRFEGYGWQVIDLGDAANDLDALMAAFDQARMEADRPSLIVVRSHIGYGAPHRQDTSSAHGEPLGEEEIRLTKKFYGWPEEEQFLVPEEVRAYLGRAVERGRELEEDWTRRFENYRKECPELAERLRDSLSGELPAGWDADIPVFPPEKGPIATRAASGTVLNAIAARVPWLVGGSADLSPSTKTLIAGSGYLAKGNYGERNIAWGIREHAMCACASGMALHGGVRPFGATFFVFSDYARPAIRLAALMGLPVIYVMTHDSIGVGEDGPTHQPVEHLASLRAMPNLCIIRPADANETAHAWRAAMERSTGPTMLVLSRQNLPIVDRSVLGGAEGVLKGGYILAREKGPKVDVILMASGSEVQLVMAAQNALAAGNIAARVVSIPSWELFRQQPQDYRDEVLPPSVTNRLAVEAGSSFGWREWVGDRGAIIALDRFGASAPAGELFKQFGFTVENIVTTARKLVGLGGKIS
ncbi:MAG: transketolase [Geobacteraceae bacterium]|nr:transketolase [Geobacteraceae bacterium]